MPTSAEPRDLLGAADPVASFFEALADQELIALRTSGTSANPRLVVRTPMSWADSFGHFARLAGVTDRSRVWIPGPVTSTMNLFAAVQARWAQAATVERASDCTHAALTPSSLEACLDDATLPAGATVIVAGDALRPTLRDRAIERGLAVHHYYGASELSFVAWGSALDDLRPFPGVECEIRDDVIWVRSDYLSLGYAGALTETADTGGALRMDADGFMSVGDRGRLTDGVLRVLGRASEAITTAGATVIAADIEAVLAPHAAGTVVITGMPHERLGALVAGVLTDEGDATVLSRIAREQLPPAQRPRRWFVLSAMPVTAAGKIDRAGVMAALADARPLPMER